VQLAVLVAFAGQVSESGPRVVLPEKVIVAAAVFVLLSVSEMVHDPGEKPVTSKIPMRAFGVCELSISEMPQLAPALSVYWFVLVPGS
jgi:hypothetical protein